VLAVPALLLAGGTAAAEELLVAGGLTQVPGIHGFGPDLTVNGGFEAHDGAKPAGWPGTDAAWSIDTTVAHGGAASLRMTDAPSVPFAQIAVQQVQLAAGLYRLSGWVRTEAVGGNAGSGVRLALDYGVGGAFRQSVTAVISGTADWTYVERPNIVITSDRVARIRLEAYREPGGTAWFDDVKLEPQLPAPVEAFLLYPNFRGMLFDDQSRTMRVDVAVTPPGGDFAGHRVDVTLREEVGGAVVAQASFPASPHLVAELDGGGMAYGVAHLLEVALVDGAGGTVARHPAYRVSRVSGATRATMTIAVDEHNRILMHGTPRFVLGVYDSGFGYSEADAHYEYWLWSPTGERRMEGLRINAYLNYWFGLAPAAPMNALMANLERRGVLYLQTGNCFQAGPASGANFQIDTSDTYVQTIGAHPSSAGYYTVDECDSQLVPDVHAQYQRLARLDPDSMTFAAQLGDPPDLFLWADSADVLSTDPYPLVGAEPAGGYAHHLVADWTAIARSAVLDARPFMTVLQFFKFTSLGRWPTLAEMRSHAYMAIVEGARGLWWWSLGANALRDVCSGWCDQKTQYMNTLKSVVGELADLEPVLIAQDAPGRLAGNSNAAAIRTRVKSVDGRRYLLAYNYTNAAQQATFTWAEPVAAVTVVNEGRTLVAAGTSFTDGFAPYEPHVYALDDVPTLVAGLVAPTAGQAVSGVVLTTAEVTGGTGETYDFAADGAAFAGGPAATVAWDSRTVGDGAHDLSVTVTDQFGRTASSAAVRVTVDNTAPETSILAGPPVPAGETSVTFAWAGSDNLTPTPGLTYAFRLEPLDAGFSSFSAATATTVADLVDGTYTFSVKARDQAGNEDPSPAVATVTVQRVPPPPPPDLVVSALAAPVSAGAGAAIAIGDTIASHAGVAGASSTAVFLSRDTALTPDDVEVGRRPIGALTAPAEDAGTTMVTIPPDTPPGAYSLIVAADAADVVAESDEGNNTATRPITIVAPDLLVAALSVPPLAAAGDAMDVRDTTKNAGPGAAVASSTRYHVSRNSTLSADDVAVGGRDVPPLSAGQSSAWTVPVTLPAGLAPGEYFLIATADGASALAEDSERNNSLSRRFTVGADLTVASLSAARVAPAGATITVKAGVKNLGARAVSSVVRYYLSANATVDGADRVLGSRQVSELAAGATSTGSTPVTIPAVPAGRYRIIAVADADGDVPEIRETNNTRSVAITVR
jgi:hypothetical protein